MLSSTQNLNPNELKDKRIKQRQDQSHQNVNIGHSEKHSEVNLLPTRFKRQICGVYVGDLDKMTPAVGIV